MREDVFLTWLELAAVLSAALVMSAAGTYYLIRLLRKLDVLDKPNKRSNHKKPVPRGGGIAVIGVFLFFFTIISLKADILQFLWPIILGISALAFISIIDDIKSLSPLVRLAVQIVSVGIVALQPHQPMFGDLLPAWLDTALIVFGWVWFINLYNFMDGIDGIAGTETLSICIGILVIALTTSLPDEIGIYAIILGVCCLGFLFFNWHPSKIILGDVGSVTLGFVTGWLLILLAMYGYWVAALILPMYYLADSGVTLLRRAIAGKKLWEPHSEHYYQQAVRKKQLHSAVTLKITILNLLLIGLAIISSLETSYSIYSLVGAILLTSSLLYHFKSHAKK